MSRDATPNNEAEYLSDGQSETQEVKIFLFDILALDGEVFHHKDILERKAILETDVLSKLSAQLTKGMSILESIDFELLDSDSENFTQQLQKTYLDSKNAGYEGLMIKPVGSEKKPSQYQGDNRSIWIKYKKDESEFGGLDNLDLVVMGAYKGKGKRKHVFGSFLLGAYD
jgi:DNA ligase-1